MVKTKQRKIQPDPSKQMISTPSSSSFKKKYKGVRMRSWGSWVSEIRAPNQKRRIWLGSYSTPDAAARAYDAALLCLKGSSANLNFPIASSCYINPDTTMSPKSIQRIAAAAAANSFVDNGGATTSQISPTSSSSMSSLPSHQIVDDVSRSLVANNDEAIFMMEPWCSFESSLQSPKFIDQMMFNLITPSDPPVMIDDFYEEGDIRLWSFC